MAFLSTSPTFVSFFSHISPYPALMNNEYQSKEAFQETVFEEIIFERIIQYLIWLVPILE